MSSSSEQKIPTAIFKLDTCDAKKINEFRKRVEEVFAGGGAKHTAYCPEKIEPPKQLDNYNVIHWSNTYKRLDGLPNTSEIRHNALRFLRAECIEYSKEEKCYTCKPNKTIYKMFPKGKAFSCTCKFHKEVVVKNPELMCSHVLALKLLLKIWNYNKRTQQEKAEIKEIEAGKEIVEK